MCGKKSVFENVEQLGARREEGVKFKLRVEEQEVMESVKGSVEVLSVVFCPPPTDSKNIMIKTSEDSKERKKRARKRE